MKKHKCFYSIKGIAFYCWIAMLFSCTTNPQQMEHLSKELKEPIVSSKDIVWFYTKNGQASFKLKSPKMLRFDSENPYVEFPIGVELESFENNGNKDAYLKADYAIQHLNDKQIEAKGNVLLKNIKGEQLETEYLIWDETLERIYTEEFVKITQEGRIIMGEGFESDLFFEEYSIKKSRGIINLEHDE